MRLKSTRLPKSERFICSSKALREAFSDFEELYISLGHLQKHFRFDSRGTRYPLISGTVVSSFGFSRDKSAILSLYSIKAQEYSESQSDEFVEKIIPQLREWLEKQMLKTETAILGYEQIIVELMKKSYKIHKLKFL